MTSRLQRLMDGAGWRILDALQQDARLSYNELGRRIGLSGPAIAERVRRMEDSGVITGYRASVALDKLFRVQAILRVNAPERNCTALGTRAQDLREVVEAYRVTGDDRLVLRVVAQSVEHLDWLIEQFGQFGTVTASLVLRSRTRSISQLSPPGLENASVARHNIRTGAPARRRRRIGHA